MITNETISTLITKLTEAHNYFNKGTIPGKQWMSDVDWLLYFANLDIMNNNISFDGFISKREMESELEEKDNCIEDLENQIYDLEDDNDKLQDRIYDLEDDNDKLQARIDDFEAKVEELESVN